MNVLRLACDNRLRCNGHGATMNLFERFSRVVKVLIPFLILYLTVIMHWSSLISSLVYFSF